MNTGQHIPGNKPDPRPFQVLTILGSPHDRGSNTRALVEDFVDDVAAAGLRLEHKIISLGQAKVLPCRGCWNCTRDQPCALSRKDDLEAIKAAMIDCDMLILASPVYTNQITAQLKALIDRLFTWCHIFPLLGKYSLCACTTGGDGIKDTSAFLEKILATYGTYSFGGIHTRGGLTPGFFRARAMARKRNRKLARRVARTILDGRRPPINTNQKRMFKVMKRKMMGIRAVNILHTGETDGQPKPPWWLLRLLKKFMQKVELTNQQLQTWAGLLSFELEWWKRRGWLDAKSLDDLAKRPVPEDFDVRGRLLKGCANLDGKELAI